MNRRGRRCGGIRALVAILVAVIAAVVGMVKIASTAANPAELAIVVSAVRSDAAGTALLGDALARGQTGTTFVRAQATQQRRSLDASLKALVAMRVGTPLERARVQAMEAGGRLDGLLALLERDTLRASDGDALAARSRELLATLMAVQRALAHP